jgi:hypothetical protein
MMDFFRRVLIGTGMDEENECVFLKQGIKCRIKGRTTSIRGGNIPTTTMRMRSGTTLENESRKTSMDEDEGTQASVMALGAVAPRKGSAARVRRGAIPRLSFPPTQSRSTSRPIYSGMFTCSLLSLTISASAPSMDPTSPTNP